MAYTDYLRQRVQIQQAVSVADGRMGDTTTWLSLTTIPCRMTTVNGYESSAYRREGFKNVVRLMLDDRIVRTDGSTSLRHLLSKTGESRYRLVFDGRVLDPISIKRQSEGMHDYASNVIVVDCTESLEDLGYADAAS